VRGDGRAGATARAAKWAWGSGVGVGALRISGVRRPFEPRGHALDRAIGKLRGGRRRTTLFGYDHQAKERAVIGESEHGRWCHLLWKSLCFSMRPVDAYWCHFSAKNLAISTNASLRSESGRQSPVPRARPRTVPDTTLNRIRCPAFTRVFPKNRCERTASGISRHQKIFLQKRLSHKGYPLYGTEPFLDRFLSEGP